ncbi:MAG: pyruvate dehydrogenase (acetyl-transferring), homodimeric type, partial [Acidimicrobiia bacterium]|nr:pyruvate dehydrogenase (acetyl-transferring), homodimeric type [Acidimicrobiia bacterium]
ARTRGFVLGATAGRTTLQGEGLQHQDGHSLLHASVIPACRSYDPAFAYELGVVIEDGIKRMYGDGEDVFYYLTVYNENYIQPPKPDGVDRGILAGLYKWDERPEQTAHRSAILFSGSANLAARKAQAELAEHYGVGAELWSATSYQELRNEALSVERYNLLHPGEPGRASYVAEALAGVGGPIVAVTDFIRAVPDQISRWVPGTYIPLGTDGFGRSDSRRALRRFFEVDAAHIVVASLAGLVRQGALGPDAVKDAITRYGIDPDVADPWRR